MHIRRADTEDYERLRELLVGALDIGFDPTPVLHEKLFGPGFGGPAVCSVAVADEVIRGVSVVCGSSLRLLVVEASSRERGIGSALLDHSVEEIGTSHRRVTVAAAAGNYLIPGVPRSQEQSIEFFESRGFEQADLATDMETSISEAERPEPLSGIEVEQVTALEDSLEQFITDQFGSAIAWEIGRGVLSERAVVRVARSDRMILGFTACEINNAGLGTFGPQGVSAAARGRGIGAHLLRHSLADLRELGYSTIRIPWVSTTEYYARSCGASVVGEYVILRKGC